MTRQYRWQLKQMANHNCITCGDPATTKLHCKEHAVYHRIRVRSRLRIAPYAGKGGKPPLFPDSEGLQEETS